MFRLISSPIARSLCLSLTRCYKPTRKPPPGGKAPIFQPFAPGKDYYNSAERPKEELADYLEFPESLKKAPFSENKADADSLEKAPGIKINLKLWVLLCFYCEKLQTLYSYTWNMWITVYLYMKLWIFLLNMPIYV